MIAIRSQNQGILLKCIGFIVSEYGQDHIVKGFTGDLKDAVILGYYDSREDACTVLDQIQNEVQLNKPIFEMPPREYMQL